MMQPLSLSFLARKIAPYLAETQEIPLFGETPHFDGDHFEAMLRKRLEGLKLETKEQRMRERAEILEGLGSNPEITSILLSPLSPSLFWVMPREQIGELTSFLLTGKKGKSPFSSVGLQEGYYRYLLLEALDVAKEMAPCHELSLQLGETVEIEGERAFCIDVQLNGRCWGRLVITDKLKSALVRHFAHLPSREIATNRAREIELVARIQIGVVHLLLEEWEALREADAIFLDRSSYNPHTEEGVATLFLGSIPIFQLRVDAHQLTILEYAFYYEDTMEGQKTPEPLSEPNREITAIQNSPLAIAVELGQLKITLEELMRLSAGNTLELPIHPDQGVALTVNGRLIGRGELVSFGEALAVRILEIAH